MEAGIKFENETFTKKLVDNELHKSAAKQIWYIQALSLLLDSDEGLILATHFHKGSKSTSTQHVPFRPIQRTSCYRLLIEHIRLSVTKLAESNNKIVIFYRCQNNIETARLSNFEWLPGRYIFIFTILLRSLNNYRRTIDL